MRTQLYAHTPPPGSHEWHPLTDHLIAVAEQARSFADAFKAGDLAYWLGLWHDLGKCHPRFQAYLQACHANPGQPQQKIDHKAAGSSIAMRLLGPLALIIQGHHGGLRSPTDFKIWFNAKAQDPAVAQAIQIARNMLADIEPSAPLTLPATTDDPVTAELFIRMLFSALVDADFLDTERHRNPTRATQRRAPVSLRVLWQRFEEAQQQISGQREDRVGQARHAMYKSCLAAADQPPGLFRLAMPTGGGKTRSAMAFALRHALRHDMQRIIVAVPFISITEQTAAIYRSIFGTDNPDHPIVLEHHSGAVADHVDDEEYDPTQAWQRLAAENWDAPVIVTTTVQLFESLFANQPSRCRKLHRLVRSVIILDEAQALPPRLLKPILDSIQQLCRHYGTTVVISTATQPAFESIPAFASLQATDIVPDAARWFDALKRVSYEWRTEQPLSWQEVAEIVRQESQALVVVNTKRDAMALLDALESLDVPDVLHLSTLLCGAHRREVIDRVRERLNAGQPCRLIATQVIEAGVDLDFPLVLRTMGPLDSIIQAAGRCNREGRMEHGRLIVFQPADAGLPRGAYRAATDLTRAFVARGALDPDNPSDSRRYFQELFATLDLDRDGIQQARAKLQYSDVAQRFRMIDKDSEDVIVAYGDDQAQHNVRQIIAQIERQRSGTRALLRQLQPYLVSIRTHTAQRYARERFITPLLPGLGVWTGKYDSIRGLVAEDDRDLLVF